MSNATPLSQERKITLTYRVEPGCLGPQGLEFIEDFCVFAQRAMAPHDANFMIWRIVPRLDKSLPEMEYGVLGKTLSHQQAEQYLAALGKDIEVLEERLIDNMAQLIDGYFRR